MTTEQYQKQMAALGITRGAFEPDAEFAHITGVTDVREPVYINGKASTKAEKLPMQPVAEHLKCNVPKNAGNWWGKLSPKERKKHSQQRSRNAKLQGR